MPKNYHTQLNIKIENLSLSILYNSTVELPDLYLSENIPDFGLNMTPKEHPIDNKVMFWLHECNLNKVFPKSDIKDSKR